MGKKARGPRHTSDANLIGRDRTAQVTSASSQSPARQRRQSPFPIRAGRCCGRRRSRAASPDDFLLPVPAAQPRHNAGLVGREGEQLSRALDLDAEAIDLFLEQSFGLALRNHQRVGKRTGDAFKGEASQFNPVAAQARTRRTQPRGDKRFDGARAGEQLERARPDHQRFRFVRPRRAAIDDPAAQVMARELSRQGQTDRSGTDDERIDRLLILHSARLYPETS